MSVRRAFRFSPKGDRERLVLSLPRWSRFRCGGGAGRSSHAPRKLD